MSRHQKARNCESRSCTVSGDHINVSPLQARGFARTTRKSERRRAPPAASRFPPAKGSAASRVTGRKSNASISSLICQISCQSTWDRSLGNSGNSSPRKQDLLRCFCGRHCVGSVRPCHSLTRQWGLSPIQKPDRMTLSGGGSKCS